MDNQPPSANAPAVTNAMPDKTAGTQPQSVVQRPTAQPAASAAQSKEQPSNYRIEVKRDLCIGAASCVAVAPETFALDDENIAIIKNPAGNPDDSILMAAQACPTKAIYIFEANKQVWPE